VIGDRQPISGHSLGHMSWSSEISMVFFEH